MPDGLILWWLVRPRYGVLAAVGVLSAIGVATVAGFAAGGLISGSLESRELAYLEAFVSGSLLHLAVHQRESHHHGA